MDFTSILQTFDVYTTAGIVAILLVFRTLASLVVYKMLGEWCSKSFIDGLFKQMVLYAMVFVMVVLIYVVLKTAVDQTVLTTVLGMYYSVLAVVLTYTVGKLTILAKYALDQGGSLDDFIQGSEKK